jgi:hypothetical protein
MDSLPKDPSVATEARAYHLENRRTLEFFIIAGLIGLGLPCAILMGAQAGEKTAAAIYRPAEPGY